MTPLIVIICYLFLLLALGLFSSRFFRGTSKDYFVASHSIGPFLLLMSVFGTTMTAFALVGSTGKSFERGIGVYGLMASSSALIHAACFFLIGIRLWVFGKKYGYVTQIQYFRARFESNALGYVLFPILVGLVIPYLLIGVIGAGKTILPVTAGAFPVLFESTNGGIPEWLSGLVVCVIVLMYVFAGGSRAAAWANTFQTIVFMVMGLVAFLFISNSLGGLENAAKVAMRVDDGNQIVQTHKYDPIAGQLVENDPPKIIGKIRPGGGHGKVGDADLKKVPEQPHLQRTVATATYKKIDRKAKKPVMGKDGKPVTWEREYGIPPLMFLTYMFIPLSVGMFPHLFQHWLTAKSAKTFRLTLIAHPLCIMIVWVPCVLIGSWASGLLPSGIPPAAVLSVMLKILVGNPILIGLLTAGILAAIMSSLDSQFHCMGTIFTNDIVLHIAGEDKYSDRQIVWMARLFTIGIVVLTYVLAMLAMSANVFDLAVWCFTGFAALTPVVIAALYWRRATKAGAYASIIATMATWFYFFQASGYGGEYTVAGGVMPVAICFAAGAVAMIAVSLLTPPPSRETIDKFFP
ncbi:MAG: sodium:solute symporter family protein [Planctomycetota bacterium]|nr:sodium:solute symporter family protein [Planctomycetota bacterium]